MGLWLSLLVAAAAAGQAALQDQVAEVMGQWAQGHTQALDMAWVSYKGPFEGSGLFGLSVVQACDSGRCGTTTTTTTAAFFGLSLSPTRPTNCTAGWETHSAYAWRHRARTAQAESIPVHCNQPITALSCHSYLPVMC